MEQGFVPKTVPLQPPMRKRPPWSDRGGGTLVGSGVRLGTTDAGGWTMRTSARLPEGAIRWDAAGEDTETGAATGAGGACLTASCCCSWAL